MYYINECTYKNLKLNLIPGPAVNVGVSMFVLSISELSEVGMVRIALA
jgi:hypothetical protein